MKSFIEFLEDKMDQLESKVNSLVEAINEISEMEVINVADDLGFSITKRQAKAVIKKAMRG